MEIQKVFTDYYDTERLYSVLMSEDELRLFAFRDYAGLTKGAAKKLKWERNQIAKELNEARKRVSKSEAERLDSSFSRTFKSRYDKNGNLIGSVGVRMKDTPKIARENLLNMSNDMANTARRSSSYNSGFFGRLGNKINSNTRPIARSNFNQALL